ncbi:MAG: SH3-like domain-containing protein, partial [Flavobacteriaceae bacterium]|nr:SH3-like domain-containing protein [Flavobacteriaceae bacterium]
MINKVRLTLIAAIVLIFALACNKGPKVITSSDNSINSGESTGIFSKEPTAKPIAKTNQSLSNEMHKVTVVEILSATKYVYLNVKENGEQYWLATRKQDINVGEDYFYKGGLLKTNFESKEHNKVFEKIYLVTSLVQANHSNNTSKINQQKTDQNIGKENPTVVVRQKGSIKISELIENIKEYEGKTVQITGKCVKINPNIMGKNWIHIKDGSKDDYDLVITSDTFVKEGSMVT